MREELSFQGLHNSLAENKTPKGQAYAMQNAMVDRGIIELSNRYTSIGSRTSANAGDIGWGLGYGKFGCNKTQKLTVTGTPTGGTLVLKWRPSSASSFEDVGSLAYTSTAAEVKAALLAITFFEAGEITTSGGPWPTYPIYVTTKGRYALTDVDLFVLKTNGLTGGSTPSITIANYVTGGTAEEYLTVVQHSGDTTATLYKVTSSDSWVTTTWTSLATGLTASDWHFVHYSDKIYAANATDGLQYKQLGGDWSGGLRLASSYNPVTAPTVTEDHGYSNLLSSGATHGTFVNWGSNPSITGVGFLTITLNAALSNDTVSFITTYSADADYSYEDFWTIRCEYTAGEMVIDAGQIDMQLLNSDGTPASIDPVYRATGLNTTTKAYRTFHFANNQRALRDNSRKVKWTLHFDSGTSGKVFTLTIWRKKTWPKDTLTSINMDAGPTRGTIDYAYSYVQTTTGLESTLSPLTTSPTVPATAPTTVIYAQDGSNQTIVAPGNASLLTSDFINYYRKDATGNWRLLGRVANATSGTVSYTDKYMEEDMGSLNVYTANQLPEGFAPEVLGLFKQSLIVGADRKIWLSYVGSPVVFADDPENPDAAAQDTTDIDIPRTLFMADNRAEAIKGFVGQDSLYIAGEQSSYAMVGDRPSDLSPPRRLPGSRGAVGTRAVFPQQGGGLVGASEGLWHYAVSRAFGATTDAGAMLAEEITRNVRRSWITTLLGSSYTALVLAVYQDEVYAFNGAKYLKFTKNGQVEEGTLTDSVKAAHVSSRFVWIDSKGRLMKFGEYATDAATAVTWSYTTGLLDGGRVRIERFEALCTGTPRISVTVYDGLGSNGTTTHFDCLDGAVTRLNVSVPAGFRYKFSFSGSATAKVENVAVFFDPATGGKGN